MVYMVYIRVGGEGGWVDTAQHLGEMWVESVLFRNLTHLACDSADRLSSSSVLVSPEMKSEKENI